MHTDSHPEAGERYILQSISSAERGRHAVPIDSAPSPSRHVGQDANGRGNFSGKFRHRQGDGHHLRQHTFHELDPLAAYIDGGGVATKIESAAGIRQATPTAAPRKTHDAELNDAKSAGWRVFWIALLSRIIYLVLFVAFDVIMPDYDTSPELGLYCTGRELVLRPGGPGEAGGVPFVSSALQGLMVWDTVHFVAIAKCGYEYENQAAFFPFVPLSMRLLHNSILLPASWLLGVEPTLILAGLLVSMLSFALSAYVMYRLSLLMTASPTVSATASMLYILNPSAAHHSAAYCEAPFALLSMLGTYLTMRSDSLRDQLGAALSFAGATCVRSNGVINIGYLGWSGLTMAISHRREPSRLPFIVTRTAALCCVAVAPFVVIQIWGYHKFCGADNPMQRPWCSSLLPNLYGFVQSHYWNNGLFAFWTLEHLPNFVTALPILIISFGGAWAWLEQDSVRTLSLGLLCKDLWIGRTDASGRPPRVPRRPKAVLLHADSLAMTLFSEAPEMGHLMKSPRPDARGESEGEGAPQKEAAEVEVPFMEDHMAPFVLHWAFSAVFALLFMHVEVATRFMSTLPVLYWCCASFRSSAASMMWTFFIAYFLVGTLLFPNFYPWT